MSSSFPLITSNSFREIEAKLSHLPEGSIIQLDVDNTLAYPEDPILTDPHGESYKKICSWHNVSLHPHGQARYCCVDPYSVDWVRSLQKRNMYVIAFTAVAGRHRLRHDDVPNWRSKQLKDLGFQFSDADREIVFDGMLSPQYSSIPLFQRGILYSAQRPKGDVLAQFIEKTERRFPHAVLIDDAIENLSSVATKVRELEIPFTGVLFNKAWRHPPLLDEALASRQLLYFSKTKRWQSDPTSIGLDF